MPVVDKFQIGMKKETTYGTRVVPDHFIEARSESFSLDQRFFTSAQLGGGTMFPRGSRRVSTTRSGTGSLVFEVPNKGYGAWLDLMHGNAVTPVQQAATAAYLQTHNIGLTAPSKSATIQFNRPDSADTNRPFDYLGCLPTSVTWACDVDDALVNTIEFDVRDEDTAQTLATRSLPSALRSFVFTQGALAIAGSNVADVTNCSLTVNFPRATDFYPLGTTGLKNTPIQNAMSTGTGTATARFTDLTHYNRYKNNTQVSLALTFTGPLIASTYYEQIIITCNQVGFTGETPTVDSPEVLTHGIPFEVLYDGTNAPVIVTYMSVDVTL
jgi:hypothetical protein